MYKLNAALWRYPSDKASWFFVTVPKKLADKLKADPDATKTGWGQIKVEVTVGSSTWKTSLFPDKQGKMVLPIKKAVRDKEEVYDGGDVKIAIALV